MAQVLQDLRLRCRSGRCYTAEAQPGAGSCSLAKGPGEVAAKATSLAVSGMKRQEQKPGKAKSCDLRPYFPLLGGAGYPLKAK